MAPGPKDVSHVHLKAVLSSTTEKDKLLISVALVIQLVAFFMHFTGA
jgi:hypothetical protein